MVEGGRVVRVIIDERVVFANSAGERRQCVICIVRVSALLVIVNSEIVLAAPAPVEGIQPSLMRIVLWNDETV